jgi:hypothetical protein
MLLSIIMPSAIEVERRALLTAERRETFLGYLHNLGPVSEIGRVMIDYSEESRTRTVMIRINNGQQEIVTKTGSLTDDVRQEVLSPLPTDMPLEQTLTMMASKGYILAKVSRREMHVLQTGGLEYSVRDVISGSTGSRTSTLLEIEATQVAPGDEQSALAKINQAFTTHDITPMNGDEWTRWVARTHEHDDQTFMYTPEAARVLTASLASTGLLGTLQ